MTDTPAPAFIMVQIRAKSFEETMARYGQSALATVAAFGGEFLAGTPTPQVLEGEWDGNWAAVLRFPSLAAAEKWYHSPEYLPLKDLRINELTEMNRVLLLEGVGPAPQP
jgi:uncharacterized protein (DUF1330 family)